MTASVVTSRKVGTKVTRTQLHVSSVYSRKSTKYLPAPREESRATISRDAGWCVVHRVRVWVSDFDQSGWCYGWSWG